MKTVFTNAMVAHVWAQQTQEFGINASGSLYFQDATIYSYGSHFPIARFIDRNIVLLTADSYSNTTAQHISLVHRAIPSTARVFVVDIVRVNSVNEHAANLTGILDRANNAIGAANRSRKYSDSEFARAIRLHADAVEYADKFELPRPRDFSPDVIASILDRIDRQQREQTERDAKLAERLQDEATAWQSGKRASPVYDYPRVLLRVVGDNVETSRGASVPVSHAVRMYRFLADGRDIVGARIGHFTVNRVTDDAVHIGCHIVPRDEMERIAELLGVKK